MGDRGNYFDEQQRQQVERRLVRRLERLGYDVTLQPTENLPRIHLAQRSEDKDFQQGIWVVLSWERGRR